MSLKRKWRIRWFDPDYVEGTDEMTRDEFREALSNTFTSANSQFRTDLDEFANRAQKVAWGAWKARLDGGGSCGCPALSIATLP